MDSRWFSGMVPFPLSEKGMAWKTLAFLLMNGQASSKNDGVNSTLFLWGLGSSIFQRESPIFQAIPLP
ncbi:hypothetical protein ACFFGV_07085 [Pontibacillus salicampi]|uniref:Uncharacterized protein n=1 Tax=Pontibacillus salicampi TaxID=1449801 RepID=A0ABV6LLS5_9BACI